MNKQEIEIVLREQEVELKHLLNQHICTRKEEERIDLDNRLAQVVIGVRRSGKSTLCLNVLRNSGKQFAYVNFDDERLAEIKGKDLNDILEVLYKIYGDFKYLFIDEIQNIPEWFLFVNRLLRLGLHILVTGSNAKLLSGELATHLTGRYIPTYLYPFSFAEYCRIHDVDTSTLTTFAIAQRRAAFDNYVQTGGFPETFRLRKPQTYINTLVNNVIERDIKQRYRLRYSSVFVQLAHHLLNVSPSRIVVSKLQELFKVSSAHTVENYLMYLKQAYLLIGVHRYSAKSSMRIRDEKLYAVDVSFMNNRADAFAGENLGWRLETIVLLELCRRHKPYCDIYYYSEGNSECDFVVCEGNRTVAVYQVCYDLSSPKTRKREIRGCIAGAKATNCANVYMITNHDREDIEEQGYTIKVIPAYEWLLES